MRIGEAYKYRLACSVTALYIPLKYQSIEYWVS